MKNEVKFYLFFSLAIAETVALVWFSLQPAPAFVETGGLLRLGDMEHFIAYAVYGFLWSGAFVLRKKIYGKMPGMLLLVILPLIAGSVVGALCESLQLFAPSRVADPLDWSIDTLGSFAGALIACKIKNLF